MVKAHGQMLKMKLQKQWMNTTDKVTAGNILSVRPGESSANLLRRQNSYRSYCRKETTPQFYAVP